MALTATMAFSLNTLYTPTASDFGTPASAISYAKTLSFASGTGAGQSDVLWADQRIVTTGATDDLDLAGTLTNVFGATITIVKLRGVLVWSALANTTNISLTRGATLGVPLINAVSAGIGTIGPGGFFGWSYGAVGTGGVTVAAGTADILSITNAAGASATVDIFVFGTSA